MSNLEPVEVEVTWEDQKMINQFGRLNNKFHEYTVELKGKQTDLEDLREAENEILIAEEELVKYRVGEIYVSVPQTTAEEMIAEETKQVEKQVDHLTHQMEEIKQVMAQLKVKLYAKFGKSINLEEGDE